MNLTIRKCLEQQAELLSPPKVYSQGSQLLRFCILLTAVCVLFPGIPDAAADIYRFVTIDGVETFTDAPQEKSATVIMKEGKSASGTQRGTPHKTKQPDTTISVAPPATSYDGALSFEPRLPPVGGIITSRVGMRVDPIDGLWRQHNGIDIAIPTGTPVKPAATGVVVYSGIRSGYGNTIIIEHDGGIITLYGHNSRLLAEQGKTVTPESTVALSGSTGRSTGPHLHFEAWRRGVNITETFLSGGHSPAPSPIASNRPTARFRSEALSDGSILFTNIPESRH